MKFFRGIAVRDHGDFQSLMETTVVEASADFPASGSDHHRLFLDRERALAARRADDGQRLLLMIHALNVALDSPGNLGFLRLRWVPVRRPTASRRCRESYRQGGSSSFASW